MKKKKHIDHLFQEKFKDFHPEVHPDNWEAIKAKLELQDTHKPLTPLWVRISSIAAVLLLFMGLGIYKLNDSQANPVPIVNTKDDKTEQNKKSFQQKSKLTFTKQNNTKLTTTQATSKSIKPAKTINFESYKKVSAKEEKINQKNHNENNGSNSVATNLNNPLETLKQSKNHLETPPKDLLNKQPKAAKTTVSQVDIHKQNDINKNNNLQQTIEEALALRDSLLQENDNDIKRWVVSPRVAPVYFNSFNEGSTIHNQFIKNDKSSLITMSYGVSGSYKINQRIKLRTGINQVSLNHSTNDVMVYDGAELQARGINARIDNIKLNANHSTKAFLSAKALNSNVPEIINTQNTGSLEQRFGFIEIPLEVQYAIVNKKLGFNVVGGVSTLFLNQNEIYTNINGQRDLVGEALNLNNTSFTANFGLGVDYQLGSKLDLYVEPTLKYQFNTFNNTSGNVTPYFLALYTGVNFKF